MNVFIASVDDKVALMTAEESWHCTKVLRKKVGDTVHLIDGVGNFFEGVLELVSEKQCRVKITQGPRAQPKRNYYLHLAIAPTKQMDRIEWMLEKAVEIGVDEISFIASKNSERTVVKHERVLKIVESAVKQSLQAYLPKINEISSFKDLITTSVADQKLIAHCYELPKQDIKRISFKDTSTLILIGPEGDFTLEEVELSQKNKFEGLSLGNNRLRAETAGLCVCQAASLLS
ncbi:16S rRNA (uracil(1498)-N(3))-methyltransferase [Aurantibacillus circumpalustris]|uniref:16S rRNA (uracil(1498)-N(3))-methyltransferase n=1 Tax=Aurantibacillus circumpalustris TaxID=3036359 RepID=UPI00295AA7E5|nr:16S rRNA (uracil(1498)-N(3))-methyltransferase [Aurantibacillus circumpalustris]